MSHLMNSNLLSTIRKPLPINQRKIFMSLKALLSTKQKIPLMNQKVKLHISLKNSLKAKHSISKRPIKSNLSKMIIRGNRERDPMNNNNNLQVLIIVKFKIAILIRCLLPNRINRLTINIMMTMASTTEENTIVVGQRVTHTMMNMIWNKTLILCTAMRPLTLLKVDL